MGDKFYIGDLPDTYHYAEFLDDSIILYNQSSATNQTILGYRIFYNYSGYMRVPVLRTFGQYTTNFYTVPVSKNFLDRPDAVNIILIVFIFSVFGLWLTNLFTSLFKKGGILRGLF